MTAFYMEKNQQVLDYRDTRPFFCNLSNKLRSKGPGKDLQHFVEIERTPPAVSEIPKILRPLHSWEKVNLSVRTSASAWH